MDDELMGAVDQSVVKVVARRAYAHLKVGKLGQGVSVDFLQTGSKDHALALLDVELKVAGHIEVLRAGIAALLLLRVFQASVPVGTEDELVLLVNLHEECRIARIHAGRDAILHDVVVTVHPSILVCEFAHAAESQEGL